MTQDRWVEKKSKPITDSPMKVLCNGQQWASCGCVESKKAGAPRDYSFAAAANRLLTFCSDASSSAFTQVCERSIWRISPVRTLPGPTSTNVCTPRLISVCMDLAH